MSIETDGKPRLPKASTNKEVDLAKDQFTSHQRFWLIVWPITVGIVCTTIIVVFYMFLYRPH